MRAAVVASVAVVAVLLAVSPGCGDATIDVGPAAPSDPCDFWGRGCVGRPAVEGELSYRFDGMAVSSTAVKAYLIGPIVTFSADGVPRALEVSVWAMGTGVFRCEDAATAGRTHIRAYGNIDTALGGTCEITITRFPTTEDARLEGTFFASFDSKEFGPGSKIENGSFSFSGVGRF